MYLDNKSKQGDRRERDARRGRLGPGRFESMVTRLAGVIRISFQAGETSSLFGLEGPLRHDIRADLCRQGWRWKDADDIARELLEHAFRRVRANRPSWNEGQPEWTRHAGTLIGHTICIRCKKPLPEGKFKFCCNLCAKAHGSMLERIRKANEGEAYNKVVMFHGQKDYVH